jgi:hypothetical protein
MKTRALELLEQLNARNLQILADAKKKELPPIRTPKAPPPKEPPLGPEALWREHQLRGTTPLFVRTIFGSGHRYQMPETKPKP